MGSLTNFLSRKAENIELGIVKSNQGGSAYTVTLSGVEKRVYNTSGASLSVGDRVLISKLSSGKRYIMSKTGFSGDFNKIATQEVFIDG